MSRDTANLHRLWEALIDPESFCQYYSKLKQDQLFSFNAGGRRMSWTRWLDWE